MIQSMTGIGRAEKDYKSRKIYVELRSLNHRYLDISLRLSPLLSDYETIIREMIRRKIRRGSLLLHIGIEEKNFKSALELDYNLAKNYLALSKELKTKFGLSGRVDINNLLQFPGMIKLTEKKEGGQRIWRETKPVIKRALDELIKMRKAEGKNLEKDFRTRLKRIENLVKIIKHRADKLQKRNRRIDLSQNPSPEVGEECVRLNSHIKLFFSTMRRESPSGRKLDFILQEMLKEANTISSKSLDTPIVHRVIVIKEEIEKLREQIQNVE